MKILVAVKSVLDAAARPHVKADGSGIDLANAKISMNPFDEIAVEQAIRMKESGIADEVIVASIGAGERELRTALAMGADRGILVKTSQGRVEPLAVAKIFGQLAKQEGPSLILLGKQSIDEDNGQTGQMLAAIMGCAQATNAAAIDLDGEFLRVTREVDGGTETVRLSMPAVVTTDLRLAQPRYATLPNIMKAKAKPLAVIEADSMAIDLTPRLSISKVQEPPKRAAGIKVADVDALVTEMHNLGLAPAEM